MCVYIHIYIYIRICCAALQCVAPFRTTLRRKASCKCRAASCYAIHNAGITTSTNIITSGIIIAIIVVISIIIVISCVIIMILIVIVAISIAISIAIITIGFYYDLPLPSAHAASRRVTQHLLPCSQ